MNPYKKILVAIDNSKEAHRVLERAKSLADEYKCPLHVMHVVEPSSMAYNDYVWVGLSQIEEELEAQARIYLERVASEFHVPHSNQHLVIGSPTHEIHALAESIKADLIVVGSHGRSGFAILLGSTANGVLHGSQCDVLAVRVALKE